MKWMPRSSWENIWSVWSVGSLLVFPFLAAFYTVACPRVWLPRGSRSSHRERSLLRIRLGNRAGPLRAQRGSSAMRRQAIGMAAMDNFPIARQPRVMEIFKLRSKLVSRGALSKLSMAIGPPTIRFSSAAIPQVRSENSSPPVTTDRNICRVELAVGAALLAKEPIPSCPNLAKIDKAGLSRLATAHRVPSRFDLH
jgi:hypothetical protein